MVKCQNVNQPCRNIEVGALGYYGLWPNICKNEHSQVTLNGLVPTQAGVTDISICSHTRSTESVCAALRGQLQYHPVPLSESPESLKTSVREHDGSDVTL